MKGFIAPVRGPRRGTAFAGWGVFFLVLVAALAAGACSILKAQPTEQTPTGSLQGVVTGPSGPVSGALVQVTTSAATTVATQSDPNGFFALKDVPQGTALLTVSASGYYPFSTSVNIRAKATTTANVSLSVR